MDDLPEDYEDYLVETGSCDQSRALLKRVEYKLADIRYHDVFRRRLHLTETYDLLKLAVFIVIFRHFKSSRVNGVVFVDAKVDIGFLQSELPEDETLMAICLIS